MPVNKVTRMKINASVQVCYRLLSTQNKSSDKRAVKSTLTIGKHPAPKNELFIIHQSQQFVTGHKYKVKDNIEAVFTRFLNEGKATIRFKVPEHDLIISANPVQIKAFLRLLKLGLDEKTPLQSLQLSSLSSTGDHSALKPVKTKLIVKCKNEYPTISGFPRTLEVMRINNAEMKCLDRRILRLQCLRILDLSDNRLQKLPETLGTLSSLTELYLSDNLLGNSPDWRWITSPKIRNGLRLLDLRFNQITFLPNQLVKLNNLVSLRLDGNKLGTLPLGIGNLKKLRYLTASKNNLQWLPGSIRQLCLDAVDITGNLFWNLTEAKMSPASFTVLSLGDLAAKQILIHGIPVSEQTLPRTLIQYLENCTYCTCGLPSFTNAPTCFAPFNLCRISCTVTRDHSLPEKGVPLETRFCSFYCYKKSSSFSQ